MGLLLGCTRLNPAFGGEGEEVDSEFGSVTEASGTNSGPDPSLPSEAGSSANPTLPTSPATLGPSMTNADSSSGTLDPYGTSSTTMASVESTGSTTGQPPGTCSTYEQDCRATQKCMPWADGGGNAWNALGCFPLAPSPGMGGDPCMAGGSGLSGLDDCDVRSMCWDIEPEENVGTCVPFCVGSPDSPTCESPQRTCIVSNGGVISLCLLACDPLLQDCDGTSSCQLGAEGFGCVPDASGDMGAVGDPCEFINVCDPGNLCVEAANVPGCVSAGCCTAFCDTTLPSDPCPGPQVCIPLFEKGAAPPGNENAGYCGQP